MKAKRIECYVHSDNATPNKGGSLIELLCETDFAAKTELFSSFAHKVAQLAYGSQKTKWGQIIEQFPDLELERKALSQELGEEIGLGSVVMLPMPEIWEDTLYFVAAGGYRGEASSFAHAVEGRTFCTFEEAKAFKDFAQMKTESVLHVFQGNLTIPRIQSVVQEI